MFGLFKKKIEPYQFGYSLMYIAKDDLGDEAASSLGMQFPNFDASNGWIPFLESRGVSIDQQLLYVRLYQHCSLQAACTCFEATMRRVILDGAMAGFRKQPEDYQFNRVYRTLTAAYDGEQVFHHLIEALSNREASIPDLPNPNAGVINARFLIDTFIKPRMPNAPAYLDNFEFYSLGVAVGVATTQRAISHLLRDFKLVG